MTFHLVGHPTSNMSLNKVISFIIITITLIGVEVLEEGVFNSHLLLFEDPMSGSVNQIPKTKKKDKKKEIRSVVDIYGSVVDIYDELVYSEIVKDSSNFSKYLRKEFPKSASNSKVRMNIFLSYILFQSTGYDRSLTNKYSLLLENGLTGSMHGSIVSDDVIARLINYFFDINLSPIELIDELEQLKKEYSDLDERLLNHIDQILVKTFYDIEDLIAVKALLLENIVTNYPPDPWICLKIAEVQIKEGNLDSAARLIEMSFMDTLQLGVDKLERSLLITQSSILSRPDFLTEELIREQYLISNEILLTDEAHQRMFDFVYAYAHNNEDRHREYIVFLVYILFYLCIICFVIIKNLSSKDRDLNSNLDQAESISVVVLKEESSLADIIRYKTGIKINHTDELVLVNITDNPYMTIEDISSKIYLSVDGVKTSLRRLYNKFDIKGKYNKKLVLSEVIQEIVSKGDV